MRRTHPPSRGSPGSMSAPVPVVAPPMFGRKEGFTVSGRPFPGCADFDVAPLGLLDNFRGRLVGAAAVLRPQHTLGLIDIRAGDQSPRELGHGVTGLLPGQDRQWMGSCGLGR
jgi:hypothetical protein